MGSLVFAKTRRVLNSLESNCEQAKGGKEEPILFSIFIVFF